MNRRDFLSTAAVTVAAAGSTLATEAGAADAAPPAADLRTAAADAWLWGLPLIEMAGQRAGRFAEGLKTNALRHDRNLVTAKGQFVTTPNNDTLYSHAWLDLRQGPVTFSLPASGSRYYSVALMDMYSNNFAIIGTRTCGNGAQTFTVIGPNEKADIPRAIRAPTNSIWVLGRTLVDGDADLPQARAFQDGWTIKAPEAPAPKTYVKRSAPWAEYFAAVQALMNDNPPPLTDGLILTRMAPLLQPGGSFDPARFTPAQVAQIQAGIADAGKRLAGVRQRTLVRNGWSFPLRSIGDFGQDYDYRAAVAIGGLAALPSVEASYLRASGPQGKGFDSAKAWRLAFTPSELPPVDSFWSLSMYQLMPDGGLYFAENPIDRYTIGDRTAGLKRGADGSLEIVMSRTQPTGPQANWLPTPANGPFVVILRAYLPQSALLENVYQLPGIQAI